MYWSCVKRVISRQARQKKHCNGHLRPSLASVIVLRFGLVKYFQARILLQNIGRVKKAAVHTRDSSLLWLLPRSVCLGPACRPDTVGLDRQRRTILFVNNLVFFCIRVGTQLLSSVCIFQS